MLEILIMFTFKQAAVIGEHEEILRLLLKNLKTTESLAKQVKVKHFLTCSDCVKTSSIQWSANAKHEIFAVNRFRLVGRKRML